MVQPERGWVVAGNPLMVCCSPQSSRFPQILGGSLLNPHCTPGTWFPGGRCRSGMAGAARGAQITNTCSGFTNPPLNRNSSLPSRVPAASLQKHNNFTSQIIFQRQSYKFCRGSWVTQFHLNYFVFPFFASICFSFFAAVFHYFFFPLDVFAPLLPALSLTASPNPATFVFKCSNLPCSRGLRSRVNKFASVFSMQLNCTFTVDILL